MKKTLCLIIGIVISIVAVVGFTNCEKSDDCGTASSQDACAQKCPVGTIYTYDFSTNKCCCHS
jgi:hypothetical protein